MVGGLAAEVLLVTSLWVIVSLAIGWISDKVTGGGHFWIAFAVVAVGTLLVGVWKMYTTQFEIWPGGI